MVGTAKENRITIAEASKIIKDGGSYLPASWVKDNLTLYELRQGVIYSIFQLLDSIKSEMLFLPMFDFLLDGLELLLHQKEIFVVAFPR